MRWIIGDVHGMLTPLLRLMEQVRGIDDAPKWYFVGDYVNRGPDSKGVVEHLLSLGDAKFARGNHDDIFDQVLNSTNYAENATKGDRFVAFQWFLEHGLETTLASYGADAREVEECARACTTEKIEAILKGVPESHRTFFRRLPPVIEEADLFVAHAKWDPYESDSLPNLSVQLEENPQWRHKLLWGRYSEEEIFRTKAWRRTGYFGHTPVYAYAASQKTGEVLTVPIAGHRIVLVDTGAALNAAGRLTAFCADNHSFIQVDHFGKVIEAGT